VLPLDRALRVGNFPPRSRITHATPSVEVVEDMDGELVFADRIVSALLCAPARVTCTVPPCRAPVPKGTWEH